MQALDSTAPPSRVLVVNTGSSSLKLRLLGPDDDVLAAVEIERWAGAGDVQPIADFLGKVDAVDAVGHRIVHGGPDFRRAVVVDDAVRARLGALTDLAPLHQPRALAGVDAVSGLLPDVAAVGCFDTAFHATLPAAAATYALPAAWRERWGLRRYGFHGLSHAYAARRAAALVGRPLADLRIVTCHLGAGASLCAVRAGESADTTMGFTPLDGLVMATRAGSVDPGLLVWLQRRGGIGVDELSEALEHASGLAGLSESVGDMRDVVAAADRGDDRARLAFDVYVHRLRAGIAAMAAAMDGLDVLVFTGGVGEHQPRVRAAATAGLGFLGVALAGAANEHATTDAEIGRPRAQARTFVISAREDLEIARQVRTLLSPRGQPPRDG